MGLFFWEGAGGQGELMGSQASSFHLQAQGMTGPYWGEGGGG